MVGKQLMLFFFFLSTIKDGGVKLYSVKVCFCCLFVCFVGGGRRGFILKPPWCNLPFLSSTLKMNILSFSYI